MQRLSGPTMREAPGAGVLGGEQAGELPADLLLRLHAVPPRVGADPVHRIVHLDLHPENVFLTPQGPVVIDWATAREAPPGLDTAMTALILTQAALTIPAAAEAARTVLPALLRQLGGTGGMLLLPQAGVVAADEFGPDHPRTLDTRHNHANETGEGGDHATARDLHRAVADDRARVLGPDHPDTLASRHSHAYETGEEGDHVTARDLFRDLADDHARVLGPDHPDTLVNRYHHAHQTARAGDYTTARPLLSGVVADFVRVLGADHAYTSTARHLYDSWPRN
ncbi:tetratricopeptide repeat protein [Streptomyces bambusae]|uniref:tetratricopeptide repeat protein n=1 Tax=Streptomyces bambusae TaxID=1550616 RepID=UPI001CFE0BA6|nr:tetratricopeptide repeat protein [Streptomyces bambusae]MCB5163947.1 tetratricopeptide repeat protein [Streptomyces bambusae]